MSAEKIIRGLEEAIALVRASTVQGEWYRDDETGHIYMANFRVLSKEEGRRKLAAYGVTFESDDSLLRASPDQVARSLLASGEPR